MAALPVLQPLKNNLEVLIRDLQLAAVGRPTGHKPLNNHVYNLEVIYGVPAFSNNVPRVPSDLHGLHGLHGFARVAQGKKPRPSRQAATPEPACSDSSSPSRGE